MSKCHASNLAHAPAFNSVPRRLCLAVLLLVTNAGPVHSQIAPGPAVTKTKESAIADLKAAHVITQSTPASATVISGGDFAKMLLSGVNIDVRATLNSPPGSATTPALAAAAVNKLGFSARARSFAQPAHAITREDAVTIALNAAAFTGHLQPGPVPKKYPRFQDESQFSDFRSRAAAHEAVAAGLVNVGPDDKFNPKAPLQYGDAALIVNSIRAAKPPPEKE